MMRKEGKVVLYTTLPPHRLRHFLDAVPPELALEVVDASAPEEVRLKAGEEADVIIPAYMDLPPSFLDRCRRLKLVQLVSAGYDRLDLPAFLERGIPVANNGGANAPAVAEHTLGLILMVLRRLHRLWQNARSGRWREGLQGLEFTELTGKTVGIVGLGRIGRQVAKRLLGFDTTTLYHDIVPAPPEVERDLRVRRVPFEELLERSDIVTLHIPLTRSTRHLIGERELARMKEGAVLINTSRGPVVDEGALYRALAEGRLAGAGLDVFEEEPTPPDNPLLRLETVVATPHLAGTSHETWARTARFVFQNALRAVRGEPVESRVVPYD